MSAVTKANEVAMGLRVYTGCECGGAWWWGDDPDDPPGCIVASTHAEDCPRAAGDPPDDGASGRRVYWGCTTLDCERGGGRAWDMDRRWRFCPSCGGELAEITTSAGASPGGHGGG